MGRPSFSSALPSGIPGKLGIFDPQMLKRKGLPGMNQVRQSTISLGNNSRFERVIKQKTAMPNFNETEFGVKLNKEEELDSDEEAANEELDDVIDELVINIEDDDGSSEAIKNILQLKKKMFDQELQLIYAKFDDKINELKSTFDSQFQ